MNAQNIFEKHGFNKAPLTLSKERYKETFINEDVMQIGTVLIDTRTDKVIKFMEEDTIGIAYRAEVTSRFLTIDPLAEKYPWQSPYVYCSNNPVNRIDPSGMADFWHNGRVIGNDGVDDNRILVIKTSENGFGEGNSIVPGSGLSKKDIKSTVKFIKENSGNTKVFQENGLAYTNSIAIESSADNRQSMVNEVSKDNGNGGTTESNNREYGGVIENGEVLIANPGDVANPQINSTASILLTSGKSSFHSHPSGTVVVSPPTGTIGGTRVTYSFNQAPSPIDINTAGSNTHYVFGRGNNTVYVYNSNGVQAVIPMRYFVTPRK